MQAALLGSRQVELFFTSVIWRPMSGYMDTLLSIGFASGKSGRSSRGAINEVYL